MSLTYSAEILANNDDLLTQILLRLPIKPLMKFKCVSKHWCSLISEPQFSRRINSPSALFCCCLPNNSKGPKYEFVTLHETNHNNPSFKTLTVPAADDPAVGLYIAQSCNGLLLCRKEWDPNPCNVKYNYVYNPTTKQCTICPPLERYTFGIGLAYDPSRWPDEYKVVAVCLHGRTSQNLCHIEIYSSKTGSWRVSAANPVPIFSGRDGVFCNGAIHWMCFDGKSFYFDVDREQLKEFKAPKGDLKYFGASRGHLHIAILGRRPRPLNYKQEIVVYEMRKEYSEWCVKYRMDPVRITVNAATKYSSSSNLEIWCIVRDQENDDDEDHDDNNSFAVLSMHKRIIRYDFKDNSIRQLCRSGRARPIDSVHLYTETQSMPGL